MNATVKQPWTKPVIRRFALDSSHRQHFETIAGRGRTAMPMQPGEWLMLCICALVCGGLIGWMVRVHFTADRYTTAAAAQYEASERYYNTKLDQMIRQNERTYDHGIKKKN
jgi:hypothetical protein